MQTTDREQWIVDIGGVRERRLAEIDPLTVRCGGQRLAVRRRRRRCGRTRIRRVRTPRVAARRGDQRRHQATTQDSSRWSTHPTTSGSVLSSMHVHVVALSPASTRSRFDPVTALCETVAERPLTPMSTRPTIELRQSAGVQPVHGTLRTTAPDRMQGGRALQRASESPATDTAPRHIERAGLPSDLHRSPPITLRQTSPCTAWMMLACRREPGRLTGPRARATHPRPCLHNPKVGMLA
jgi:hypothetical protein